MTTESTLPASSPATDPRDRIESIDVLRGVAVLGILAINIWIFAFPFDVGANPTLWGEYFGADVVAWWTGWVALEGSQRAIFTVLFGASVYLFISRLSSDDRRDIVGRIYYRRTGWLIVFALCNSYLLLWEGDILFFYGVMGLLLYPMRNWKIRNLIIVALVILTLLAAFKEAGNWAARTYGDVAISAQAKLDEGLSLTQEEQFALDVAGDMPLDYASHEELAEQIDARKGGYFSAWMNVAESTTSNYLIFGLMALFWESLAFMMLGMAFFRLKLFDASRSTGLYAGMTVIGFAVGLSVNTWEMITSVANDYTSPFSVWSYDIGRFAMATGYTGLIMLICKLGWFGLFRRSLSAVGKMALSNYIAHSVICMFIFIVLGLYGQLRFHQIYYVVFAIWAVQIVISPIWLTYYKYGPLEWLWRRLTYGQPVSFRLQQQKTAAS